MAIAREVPPGITAQSVFRIYVEKLFGQYTYDLKGGDSDVGSSRLLILYGDNGSGKTTLLKCIFHLLSPATDRRHRLFIARTKFRRLFVELGDGTVVAADREGDNLEGSFTLSIRKPQQATILGRFDYDAPNKKFVSGQNRKEVLSTLKLLDLRLHFLSDDRKIITDLSPEEEEEDDDVSQQRKLRLWKASSEITRATAGETEDTSLGKAIQRVNEWVKNQAISGSGAGEVSAQTLYTDIVKKLALLAPEEVETTSDLEGLITEFEMQAARSIQFAKFGLAPEFAADEILQILRSLFAKQHSVLLSQILRPYVDGVRLRLDALENLRSRLALFLDIMNAFYRGKVAGFSLRAGVVIRTGSGEPLSPTLLSSGEKQLLLLFCNVLSSGEQSSVFIIDEPELSLNVKWQRNLITALLECTRGYSVQFILATHSVELLTQYTSNVLELKSADPS